jgi:hypothetical protein
MMEGQEIELNYQAGVDVNALAEALGEPLANIPETASIEEHSEVDSEETQDSEEASLEEEAEESTNEVVEDEEEFSEQTSGEEPSEDESPRKYRAYQAKGADGEEIELHGGLVIRHKVNGEIVETTLQDALSREAGELTFEQRLSKLSHEKNAFEGERQELEAAISYSAEVIGDANQFLGGVVQQIQSGEVDKALATIAARFDVPPGQVYRALFNKGVHWASLRESHSPEEFERTFANIDNQYYQNKEKRQRASQQEQQNQTNNLNLTMKFLNEASVDPKAFYQWVSENREQYQGLPLEQAVPKVIEDMQGRAHFDLITQVVEEVDPSLRGNERLIDSLYDITSLGDSADDIRDLVMSFVEDDKARKATNLGRKAKKERRTNTSTSAKSKQGHGAATEEKARKVTSASDIMSEFGL